LSEADDPKTVERQRVILAHLSGQITATQAALELGVSRKTFYEWQERGLAAMRLALQDRPAGRPAKPLDPEKAHLRAEVANLEKDRLVLASRLRIQAAMREAMDAVHPGTSPPKKKRDA